MTDLSRRTLLGTAGAIGVGAGLAGAAQPPALSKENRMGPARAALERLLPGHADQFALHHLRGGRERFRVTGATGRIEVAATGPAAALTGVHWYLKYGCGAHISWSGSQLNLPARLPAPRTPLAHEATVPHRFAFNDTHDGYTAPYADWARWERLIDVLALHGCNEVLVTAGQEAVYHRLLQDFGYIRTPRPAPGCPRPPTSPGGCSRT